MRFLLMCITIITMGSCQKPHGTVTTNDEKSEIIKTLFQEVSNENIAYLEAVFSDSLVFINPHEQTLTKTEFGKESRSKLPNGQPLELARGWCGPLVWPAFSERSAV